MYFYNIVEEDFTPGQYDVTFLSHTTQATVNVTLKIDDIDEETEYFMLNLYIPSAAYGLGIQQGDIIKAVAIILRPGKQYVLIIKISSTMHST